MKESRPCHYIPLNEQDDTIESLHHWSTPEELEAAVSEWLMNTIQKLEFERTQRQSDGELAGEDRGPGVEEPRRSEAHVLRVFESGLYESFRLSPADGCFVFTTIGRTV